MERKTKHRILGFLVIIGLIIIILPLLQTHQRNSSSTVTPEPTFPGQTAEAKNLNQPAEIDTQESNTLVSSLDSNDVDRTTIVPVTTGSNLEKPVIANGSTPQQDSPVLSKQTIVTYNSGDVITKTINALPVSTQLIKPQNIATNSYATQKFITTNPKKSAKTFSTVNKKADNKNLLSLKGPQWVVQMGSFKQKNNAIRLVNQLRSKGYHAFMKVKGTSTRVYVGPANHKHNVQLLANEIKQRLHMQGIVVDFKPLII